MPLGELREEASLLRPLHLLQFAREEVRGFPWTMLRGRPDVQPDALMLKLNHERSIGRFGIQIGKGQTSG